MSEEQIQVIVDKSLKAYQDSVRKRNQWLIGLVSGALLTILVTCVGGVVSVIQNDTKLSMHTSDGHPETVKKLIRDRDTELAAQRMILTEIRTNQVHIMESVSEIKKKLIN